MKRILIAFSLAILCVAQGVQAQNYRPVKGWPAEINDKLESFLNSKSPNIARKVLRKKKLAAELALSFQKME